MKIFIRTYFSGFRYCLFILICLLVHGCVYEQMDGCKQYKLMVKAIDPEGRDITSSCLVSSTDIYLFDKNGFVRIIPKGSSTNFLFNADEAFTLVAWGNLSTDSLKLPQLSVGTSLENAKIELLHASQGCLPITDIFYCRSEVNNVSSRAVQNDTIKLVMERLAAALSVRICHVAEYFGSSDANLRIVVRGTGTSINFLGELSDDVADYVPELDKMQDMDEWDTPLFRVFPQSGDRQVDIDLYNGNDLLLAVNQDCEGNPLCALSGKETYITIDLDNGPILVTVNILPWGYVFQNVEL